MKFNCPDELFQKVLQEEKESKEFGFYWENIDQIFKQILDECNEIKEAYLNKNQEHCKEEIGDLIHAAISLSYFCGCDPYSALKISFEKYQKRFAIVQKLVKQDGLKNLKGLPTEILMEYWNKSKKILDSKYY